MSVTVSTKIPITVTAKADLIRGKVVLSDIRFMLGQFLNPSIGEDTNEEIRNQVVDALAFEATTYFEDMELGADHAFSERRMTDKEIADFEARR
jgi:hypothetical protein